MTSMGHYPHSGERLEHLQGGMLFACHSVDQHFVIPRGRPAGKGVPKHLFNGLRDEYRLSLTALGNDPQGGIHRAVITAQLLHKLY